MKVANFNEALEKDLTRLTASIEAERGQEGEHVAQSGRELVKNSLESMAKSESAETERLPEEISQKPITSVEVQTVTSPPSQEEFLPAYLRGNQNDPEVQQEVRRLIEMVFEGGLLKAMREIKKHPPFVQDAFHDALTDVLLPELERRGIV